MIEGSQKINNESFIIMKIKLFCDFSVKLILTIIYYN